MSIINEADFRESARRHAERLLEDFHKCLICGVDHRERPHKHSKAERQEYVRRQKGLAGRD